MKEELLHYIWHFQQFKKTNLTTVQGQKLKIIKTGIPNTDAGPDFLEAHVLISEIELHGHIEVHVHSSSWYSHRHHENPAYDNVILHVVWCYDKPVMRTNSTLLPTLVLESYVDLQLLKRYRSLAEARSLLPCSAQIHSTPRSKWIKMLKKALVKRLITKSDLVYDLLASNKNDSEITAYQLLAQNFGFKINSANFLQLSRVLPFKIIQKNRSNLLDIEALLLGQAGLLDLLYHRENVAKDPYINELIQRYHYLKHKYKLTTTLTYAQWKFFRLRPGNSPFIRIAQFASLLHHHSSLFYTLLNTPPEKLYETLAIRQSPYWQAHYQPGKTSKKRVSCLGKASIYNIVINTIVPLLVAYGRLRNIDYYTNRALRILRYLPAEQNKITKRWQKLNMPLCNAADSQGSIELFNNFCRLKKCFSCEIGQTILRKK